MTSRERVMAALKRESVDYVPCSPFFNPLHEVQRIGYGYQFPWRPSQREQIEYSVRRLGVDPIVNCSISAYTPAKTVSSKVWLENSIIHKIWSTPAGDLHAAVRYDHFWPHGIDIPFFSDFNIGHFIEPWLESEQDLDCLRYILRPLENRSSVKQWRSHYNESKSLADRWQLPTMISIGMGMTGAMHLFGAEQLCMMTLDNPSLVDSYLELEHQLNLRSIEIATDFGVDIVRRNGFYETADFYSPDMLEKFLAERLREEIEAVHQAGKVIGYTIHTGIMPMLSYLKKLDFDCLMHIDIAFHGVDLNAIRDSQEGRKSFWLGPSGTYHMWSQDPETVRSAVREVFRVFGRRGLLLTPCPSAHSIMPWENTLAMIDEWRKLRNV